MRVFWLLCAILLVGLATYNGVLTWPELAPSRSTQMANAMPGQVVWHGSELVEVVDQGREYTVVRVLPGAETHWARTAGVGVLALGVGLVALRVLARVVWPPIPDFPDWEPDDEADEDDYVFCHARFGDGNNRPLVPLPAGDGVDLYDLGPTPGEPAPET